MKIHILAHVGLLAFAAILATATSAHAADAPVTPRQACEMSLVKRAATPVVLGEDNLAVPSPSLAAVPSQPVMASTPPVVVPVQPLLPVASVPAPVIQAVPVGTVPAASYSSEAIVAALRDALADNPDVPIEKIKEKAVQAYKIDPKEFDRATHLLNPLTARDPVSGYTDAQVFAAIRQSVAENPSATIEQIREKAGASFNIPPAQFARAARSLMRQTGQARAILTIGDGFIGGASRDIFTQSLAGATGYRVHNRAVGGQMIKDVLANLNQDIESAGGIQTLGAVVVHVGTQDFLALAAAPKTKGASLRYSQIVADYDRLIGALSAKGIPVVVSPVPVVKPEMVAFSPTRPDQAMLRSGVKAPSDPMYRAIAARHPNVRVADGFTMTQILANPGSVVAGAPDARMADRMAISLGQSVRVATAY